MTNNSIFKRIFFGIGVLVFLVFLTILFLFISTLKKPGTIIEKKPTLRRDVVTSLVLGISPPPTQTLLAGSMQKITVSLNPELKFEKLRVNVVSSKPSDISSQTPVQFTNEFKGGSLYVTLVGPIVPVTTYTITVFYDNKLILQQSYLSGPEAPTAVPTNNPSLQTLLPHETLNYIIEYNAQKNIYIMHFKYDPDSKADLATQFNTAKTNANSFITGHNIDPKSVVIEYLYK
jgi:hypothetical protein